MFTSRLKPKTYALLPSLFLLSACFSPLPVPPAAQPSASPTVASSTAGDTAFKGWGLYTWREQGLYYWALVPDTNANPDLSRVRAEGKAGLDSLNTRLQQLARGQELFWNMRVAVISSTQFMLPPAAEQTALCALMRERGLKLSVAEEMGPVADCKTAL